MSQRKKKYEIYAYGFWASMFFERSIWTVYLINNDVSLVEIGILQTVLSIAMFIFEFPSGLLADKFGEKFTLLLGHMLNIIYLTIMLFFPYFYMLLIGFISYGIGFAMISGSDQSLLYHHNDGKSYQEKIGIYNAIAIISLGLSSFLGGVLSNFSWYIVFSLGILSQIIAILILNFLKSSRNHKESDEKSVSLSDLLISLKSVVSINNKLKFLGFSIILFQSVLSVLYNFSQLLFVEKGVSSFELSIILTLAFIFSAISSFMMDFLNKKFGKRKLIIIFMICISITGVVFKLQNIILLTIGFLLFEFSYEFIDTTLNAMLHDNIEDNIRTSFVSAVNALTSLTMFFSNILFTISLKFMSVSHIFMIGTIFCVSITMVLLLSYNKYSENEK